MPDNIQEPEPNVGAMFCAAAGAGIGGTVGAISSTVAAPAVWGVSGKPPPLTVAEGVLAGVAIGGAIGGFVGAVAESGLGVGISVAALAKKVNDDLADKNDSRRRRLEREAEGRKSDKIQLPKEAGPLLASIVLAKANKALNEKEAVDLAVAYATVCAEQELLPHRAQQYAEYEGRKLLLFVHLRKHYPKETTVATGKIATRLFQAVEPSTIDALWIISRLDSWCIEKRIEMPEEMDDVTPDVLKEVIEIAFFKERSQFALRLKFHFPREIAVDQWVYVAQADKLHEELSPSQLWKLWRLLQSPEIPEELQKTHLPLPDSVGSAEDLIELKTFLNNVPILHIRESDDIDDPEVQQAEATQSISLAAGPQRELQIEVLSAENMRDPEYRFGDILGGMFGMQELNPYIELEFRGEKKQSIPVKAGKRDGVVFGERVNFDLQMSLADDEELVVRVFDARGVQGVIRGDPLIGEATLSLKKITAGVPKLHTLSLLRNSAQHGQIKLRYGILASEAAVNVLKSAQNFELSAVAAALAQVLGGPDGVKILLETRPSQLVYEDELDEDRVFTMLQRWVARLCAKVSQLHGSSEEAALSQLAHVVRGALNIVAACCKDIDATTIVDLVAQWIRSLFELCAENGIPAHDENRLQRLLRASEACEVIDVNDPHEQLEQKFGIWLPLNTANDVASAVISRLREAEATEEEELFSGMRIMIDGKVSSGLGITVRRASTGKSSSSHQSAPPPHIFFYDICCMRKWLRYNEIDPQTREHVGEDDLLPLLPCGTASSIWQNPGTKSSETGKGPYPSCSASSAAETRKDPIASSCA